jgi:hypothetical protein
MKRTAGLHFALTLVVVATSAITLAVAPAAHADTGCPATSSGYSGGAGTSGNPYLISVPGDLQRLRDTSGDYARYFLLTQDINMGGCVWSTPISNGISQFTGTLDGSGHEIIGLSVAVTNPPAGYAGLVGFLGLSGEIRDLGFTGDVSLNDSANSGNAAVGGLVGETFASTISGSYATGNVTLNVSSNATPVQVSAGGLIGTSQGAVIDSFARGNVTATATSTATGPNSATALVGGAIGYLWSDNVSQVYSTGIATGSGSASAVDLFIGGFVGAREPGTPVTSSFWNASTSGLSSATGIGDDSDITGITTTLMQSPTTFRAAGWQLSAGFDASTTWGICSGVNGGFPFLTAFHIASPCAQASTDSGSPPSWWQSTGRLTATSPCASGWSPSWARWMNEGSGGFVCNREWYWDTRTANWSLR